MRWLGGTTGEHALSISSLRRALKHPYRSTEHLPHGGGCRATLEQARGLRVVHGVEATRGVVVQREPRATLLHEQISNGVSEVSNPALNLTDLRLRERRHLFMDCSPAPLLPAHAAVAACTRIERHRAAEVVLSSHSATRCVTSRPRLPFTFCPPNARLSCGARAPQRLHPRPPARCLLQPVARRHVAGRQFHDYCPPVNAWLANQDASDGRFTTLKPKLAAW